jgi:SSS family solute:Na+ symporter
MLSVSYLTQAPPHGTIGGLTYGTTTEHQRRESWESWSWREVIASLAVLLVILAAYLYFSG